MSWLSSKPKFLTLPSCYTEAFIELLLMASCIHVQWECSTADSNAELAHTECSTLGSHIDECKAAPLAVKDVATAHAVV